MAVWDGIQRWWHHRLVARQARRDLALWTLLDHPWPARGRLDRIRDALRRGANPNAQRTAAIATAMDGDATPGTTGATHLESPLLMALNALDLPLVRTLLAAGADPNQGWSHAPLAGDEPAPGPSPAPSAMVVMDEGWARPQGPWSALQVAVAQANDVLLHNRTREGRQDLLDLVVALLDAGADPRRRAGRVCPMGWLVLREVQGGGVLRHWPLSVLQRLDVSTQALPGPAGTTPLHLLGVRLTEHIAHKLVQIGGRLDVHDAHGLTPLDVWIDHHPTGPLAGILARLHALIGEALEQGLDALHPTRRDRLLNTMDSWHPWPRHDDDHLTLIRERLRIVQVRDAQAVLRAVLADEDSNANPGDPGMDRGNAQAGRGRRRL